MVKLTNRARLGAAAACIAAAVIPAAPPARAATPVALLRQTGAAAQGMTADGAAALLVAVAASSKPTTATLTVTNEATLIPYNSDYTTTPPTPGATTLTVAGSQIIETNPGTYVLAILQAPDILKNGPGGGLPSFTQPIDVSITLDGQAQPQMQVTLYPPPVMLVHGLWGTSLSLQPVQQYLSKSAPWKGLPQAFLTAIQYENDIAFDNTVVSNVVESSLQKINDALTSEAIAAGRVDIVAHSMGGLVARHVSTLAGYAGPANRTLGAFHHVVTINTPETGSLLASFLLDNAAIGFSKSAHLLAKLVKFAACPDATSVQSCFAEQGLDLTPPGQPLNAGAIYSLQPNSPNIAALPSANIPNAPWNALSSTVGQSIDILDYPNALVFELDELIAATCPGPSYCPTKQTAPPEVGDILQTTSNDGIVPLPSQINDAIDPVTLPHLAHTHGGGEDDLTQWVLDFSNVLQSVPADEQVGCWLASTTCPSQARLATEVASDIHAPWPGFDRTRPWRRTDRLSHVLPAQAAIGTPFPLAVHFPPGQIASITVRQIDTANTPLPAFAVPITAGPGGMSIAHVTPLATGKVTMRVHAVFTDYATADETFTLDVGAPAEPPAGFWPDDVLHQLGVTTMHLAPGQTGVLQPVAEFAGAPGETVWLKGGVTFSVQQSASAPVLTVSPDGTVKALRDGQAAVTVHLGAYKAQLKVQVQAE